MLLRKLYVPEKFLPSGILSTYLLWASDRRITIRVTIPESVHIVNVFNSVPDPNLREGVLLFSRFVTNGYLGLTLAIRPERKNPDTVTIRFEIETGLGLSEVYEKTITLQPVGYKIRGSYNRGVFAKVCNVPAATEDTPHGQGEQEARSAISAAFEQIFRKTSQISADLEDEFRIDGRALIILCPERRLKYDQVISPKNAWPLPKTVKFTSVVPSRVEVTRIPDLTPVPEAVVYIDDGYKLKLNFLAAGERYLLSLEYDFEDFSVFSRLIETGCSVRQPATGNDCFLTCEVSALIKYPDILSRGGYAVTLRDYEIPIDILLQEEAIDQTGTAVQNESFNPNKRREHSSGISPFCSAPDLQKCIKVQKDFSYQSAQWLCDGATNSAGTILPSHVKIIVRIDLSLAKPAADGSISFRYRDLFLKTE